jgi:hypothetical protein
LGLLETLVATAFALSVGLCVANAIIRRRQSVPATGAFASVTAVVGIVALATSLALGTRRPVGVPIQEVASSPCRQ